MFETPLSMVDRVVTSFWNAYFGEKLVREMSLLNPAPLNNGSEKLQFGGTSNEPPQEAQLCILVLSEVMGKKKRQVK